MSAPCARFSKSPRRSGRDRLPGISLLSLSTGDYTRIGPLTRRITGEWEDRASHCRSLAPHRRIRRGAGLTKSPRAAARVTFAPEAGTERLPRVINKPLDREAFFKIVEDVFARGWRRVKFIS